MIQNIFVSLACRRYYYLEMQRKTRFSLHFPRFVTLQEFASFFTKRQLVD